MANCCASTGWRFASSVAAVVLLVLAPILQAADPGKDLLNAARRGDAAEVEKLLDAGAPLGAKDKKGRTALVLAAENQHPEVLIELLRRSSIPVPLRLGLDATLAPDNLYSSCFMTPPQLVQQMAAIRPQAAVVEALREAAGTSGKGILEWTDGQGEEPALEVRVRPSVSCVQQRAGDSVSLAIDVRLVMHEGEAPVFQKTYGGGLTGLHSRTATSAAQYPGLMTEWARAHAGDIFWDAVAGMVGHGRK